MRRFIIIVTCLILAVFYFMNVKYSLSKGNTMRLKRLNRIQNLFFITQRDLIVGTCSSEPNGSVRFWSINDGKLMEVLDLGKGQWANSMAVSNNGNLVVIEISPKNETACYSLKERKWSWSVKWVEKGVVGNAIQFIPDDRRVVVAGFKNIVTYDSENGIILQNKEDSKGFCNGFPQFNTRNIAVSPSARYVALWQGYQEAHEEFYTSKNIWAVVRDIEIDKIIAKQGNMKQKYKNCSGVFTPDEKNLVLGSLGGNIRVWSIADQKVVREWIAYGSGESDPPEKTPFFNAIGSMTFSPKGQYLATMGFPKEGFTIRVWDYSSNKLIHEFIDVCFSGPAMGDAYPMAFSPDGKYFAFEQQGKVCLCDTQNWQEKWCVLSWPEDNRVK